MSDEPLAGLLGIQAELLASGDQSAAFTALVRMVAVSCGCSHAALAELGAGEGLTAVVWRAQVGEPDRRVMEAALRGGSRSTTGPSSESTVVIPVTVDDREIAAYVLIAPETDPRQSPTLDAVLTSTAAVVLHARDDRERRAIEDQLRDARTRAESASAAKNVFLSRMSHEIRTPLNAMLGFAQLIQIRSESSTERRDAERIVSAGRHLMTLLDEVMDVSSIEQGRISLGLTPIRLPDFVSESLQLVAGSATERSVTIRFARATAPDVLVLGDPARLRQVLINLVDNAIKYNRLGGSVTVRIQQIANEVSIDVEDEGRGIPEDRCDRVFEAFERLDAAILGIPGSGLGLAVARSLARAMSGEVMLVSSRPGRTVFRLTLPICVDADEAVIAADPVVPTEQVSGLVLHVEDNPTNAVLISSILEYLLPQVDVALARNGREAMRLAQQLQFDAVLLDLHLPDADAIDVIGSLRAVRRCPIYIVTADVTAETRRRVMSMPVDGLLTKPVAPSELVTCLTEALKRRDQAEVSASEDSR